MKKELIYVLICFVISFSLLGLPMNIKLLLQDAILAINAHDTYIVIQNGDYIIFTFVFTFSFMYFLRVLYSKFKNRWANYLYLIFNGLFIILTFFLIQLAYVLTKGFDNQTLNHDDRFGFPFYLCIVISIAAIALEIFTIVRLRQQK